MSIGRGRVNSHLAAGHRLSEPFGISGAHRVPEGTDGPLAGRSQAALSVTVLTGWFPRLG